MCELRFYQPADCSDWGCSGVGRVSWECPSSREDADTGALSCPVWRHMRRDLQLDFDIKIEVVGAVISQSWFYLSLSTRLFWQLLGAYMFEQVISVGTKDRCQQPEGSQHPTVFCPALAYSPFPIRDSRRVEDVDWLV